MACPVQNTVARVLDDGNGRVSVFVRQEKPFYLAIPPLSWIVPFKRERRSGLDALGAEIWQLCDGSRTVEQIIDVFKDQHELSFHEARVSVTGYIKALVQRGILAIAMQDE